MKESGNMVPVQTFEMTTKVIFGIESLRELPTIGRTLGKKVLVVTGKTALIDNGVLHRVETLLNGAGFQMTAFSEVEPEPSLDTVRKGLALGRSIQADWVIGLGGGSAMDVAKAIAGLFGGENELEFYFDGGKIMQPGIPLVTIPTTSGSGAEVTHFAVLSDRVRKIKRPIEGNSFAACIAVIDPQLSMSTPDQVTIYSGLDALTQGIEAFTSKDSTALSDIYAFSAVERISNNLLNVYHDGQDIKARTEMTLGSLESGIALRNAGMGAVHGLAHPIGIRTGKPHGLVCAVLLLPVMRFNLSACYEKYARITKAMGLNTVGGSDTIDVAALSMKHILSLERKLGIPTHISGLGITEAELPQIVAEALTTPAMKSNPREATADDLLNILRENF